MSNVLSETKKERSYMASKLITVERAEKEISKLQKYIELIENYEADTLEKWIVNEYAYTNSIVEVVKRINDRGFVINEQPIDKKYVTSILDGKIMDELHRLLRFGYRQRIKPFRNQS